MKKSNVVVVIIGFLQGLILSIGGIHWYDWEFWALQFLLVCWTINLAVRK